jgi:hypothetical protein
LWVVNGHYFDNEGAANKYSLDMMMAGITHYPKRLSGKQSDVEDVQKRLEDEL